MMNENLITMEICLVRIPSLLQRISKSRVPRNSSKSQKTPKKPGPLLLVYFGNKRDGLGWYDSSQSGESQATLAPVLPGRRVPALLRPPLYKFRKIHQSLSRPLTRRGETLLFFPAIVWSCRPTRHTADLSGQLPAYDLAEVGSRDISVYSVCFNPVFTLFCHF